MARRTGVARKVDQLGRVVLPAEVRRHFGINPGDLIEIAVDADAILLTKVEDRCIFCGGTTDLSEFSGKLVCRVCVNRFATERPSGA
jgi:AbrB family transcriptional regulator, transcriptional pleiotropic regulator of transition state genes